MVEVIHEHTNDSSGSGMGFLLGIIVLVIVLILLFRFGLPILNQSTAAPQINVPGKIDVNVNQPSQPQK